MKFLTLICMVTASSCLAQESQRISGIAVDSLTQEPLIFAHVGISNTALGTVTNARGAFSLLVPQEHQNSQLFISHVGYAQYAQKIQSIPDGSTNFLMQPFSTELPELTVGSEKGSIIEEAIAAIPINHDQGQMKLTGFWRAQIKDTLKHIQLSEIAFDIFRVEQAGKTKDLLKVLKGRLGRDSAAFERMNNFQAGIRPEGLFANSFLKKHTILSFRTLKTHDFKITALTSYEGRPVYVVAFDKKKTIRSMGYQGEILLDKESLAFVKISYRLSPLNSSLPIIFENTTSTKGLSKGIWERYEVELNFQHVNDQWYLSHAFFDVGWNLIKYSTKLNTSIDYHADLVVTNIDKENVKAPTSAERSTKVILEHQASFTEADFWRDYVQLVPDHDYDKIFSEIRERNKAWKGME